MLAPNHTALLVIDMQNDFLHSDSNLYIPTAHPHLSKLQTFITTCRNRGMHIIYTRKINDQRSIIENTLFPADTTALQHGSWGWQIHDALTPQPGDLVLDKPYYDAFFQTSLHERLQTLVITDLVITGTMTNVCCESTVRSAMPQGYRCHMVADLNWTLTEQMQNSTLENIGTYFGWVLESDQLLAQLV